MTTRLGWLAGIAALVAAQVAEAQQRPAVVELFTSQGCSSCPPADALLGELAGREDVLALAYHVDYWDGIGWKDHFALSAATARQIGYKRRLGLRTLYTPQMVVDGRFDLVGSDKAKLLRLLGQRRAEVAPQLSLDVGRLRIQLPERPPTGPLDVIVVAYLRHAETAVSHGENAGWRLQEFNIVVGLRVIAQWTGEARQLTVPVNELPASTDAVAVLVQEADQGAILGAASTPLHAGGKK